MIVSNLRSPAPITVPVLKGSLAGLTHLNVGCVEQDDSCGLTLEAASAFWEKVRRHAR